MGQRSFQSCFRTGHGMASRNHKQGAGWGVERPERSHQPVGLPSASLWALLGWGWGARSPAAQSRHSHHARPTVTGGPHLPRWSLQGQTEVVAGLLGTRLSRPSHTPLVSSTAPGHSVRLRGTSQETPSSLRETKKRTRKPKTSKLTGEKATESLFPFHGETMNQIIL